MTPLIISSVAVTCALVLSLLVIRQASALSNLKTTLGKMEKRLNAQEQLLSLMAQNYSRMKQVPNAQEASNDENLYYRAIDLIRQGASPEHLVSDLGLPL